LIRQSRPGSAYAHAAQARTCDHPFKNRATPSRLRLATAPPYDDGSLAEG